jgi:hypothetical protein
VTLFCVQKVKKARTQDSEKVVGSNLGIDYWDAIFYDTVNWKKSRNIL